MSDQRAYGMASSYLAQPAAVNGKGARMLRDQRRGVMVSREMIVCGGVYGCWLKVMQNESGRDARAAGLMALGWRNGICFCRGADDVCTLKGV